VIVDLGRCKFQRNSFAKLVIQCGCPGNQEQERADESRYSRNETLTSSPFLCKSGADVARHAKAQLTRHSPTIAGNRLLCPRRLLFQRRIYTQYSVLPFVHPNCRASVLDARCCSPPAFSCHQLQPWVRPSSCCPPTALYAFMSTPNVIV
jgi:hypothetical protein